MKIAIHLLCLLYIKGTFYRFSGAGINVLADARLTAAWFYAGNSIYGRLDLAGCQWQRLGIRDFLSFYVLFGLQGKKWTIQSMEGIAVSGLVSFELDGSMKFLYWSFDSIGKCKKKDNAKLIYLVLFFFGDNWKRCG